MHVDNNFCILQKFLCLKEGARAHVRRAQSSGFTFLWEKMALVHNSTDHSHHLDKSAHSDSKNGENSNVSSDKANGIENVDIDEGMNDSSL